jgi:uroporphyrinogen-III synthase
VRPISPTPALPAGVGALAVTSANGVRAFAAAYPERGWPVFAVGDATAAAAEAEGFGRVESAGGDVSDLARLLGARRPEGVVLHAAGRDRAGDLAAELGGSGVAVQTLVLYGTEAAIAMPVDVSAALVERRLDAVVVYSPKAARVLAGLLAERPLAERGALLAAGLSPACVQPLAGLGLRDLRAAERPDEAALLEDLG